MLFSNSQGVSKGLGVKTSGGEMATEHHQNRVTRASISCHSRGISTQASAQAPHGPLPSA